MNNEFHNSPLSGMLEVLVLASAIFQLTPFFDFIGHSMLLELVKGFGLVTLDPLPLCELGGF